MSSSIVKCSCSTGQSAEFQDGVYGKGMRVANLSTKSVKTGVSDVDVFCTVCSKKHVVKKSQLSTPNIK